MKAALDKSRPEEEGISFYDKMKLQFDRALKSGHRYVVGGIDPSDKEGEFSTARVSKNPGDSALEDLGEFCSVFPGAFIMAVLDTSKPFESQMMSPDCSGEEYVKSPAINLPSIARTNFRIVNGIYRGAPPRLKQEEKPVFGVIDGDKPDTMP